MHFSEDQFRFRSLPALGLCCLLSLAIQANPASAAFVTGMPVEANASFVGEEVKVLVTLDDMAAGPGNVLVNVEVIPGNIIGDIRAVFFDISDESLLPLSVSALPSTPFDVTDEKYDANNVKRFAPLGTNMDVPFDMGFVIGTRFAHPDDIQSTSFVLTNSQGNLDVSYFQFQRFGVRLANVGPDGDRGVGTTSASAQRDAKQVGTFSAAVPEPSSAFACSLLAVLGFGSTALRRIRKSERC